MPDEHGKILLSWTFPEHEQHARGRSWYIATTVIAIALLIYAFATKNFLFAVLIVMIAVVFYLRDAQSPPELTCEIMEKGVAIAGRFTSYADYHDFWILEEDDVPSKLHLHHRGMRPQFGIPLAGVDPAKVREVLRQHMTESEEEHEEPAADTIGRALKL
ncbi:hypothetical protein HY635_03010 [Candidatus Uhrbacteria bacterium]|nr:hypothetical protein [Candidatus Uhrbacteria bacterium]